MRFKNSMMKNKIVSLGLAGLCCLWALACKPTPAQPDPTPGPGPEPSGPDLPYPIHKDGDPYDTYKGLIMAGYQGWFGTPDDGSPLTAGGTWYHYGCNGMFAPGVLRNSIDFWPDMREYEKTYTVEKTLKSSPFILPDGSHAAVFSSYDEETVLLHFKWMQDYGLDGVWMQRFVSEIRGASNKDHFDKVLRSAMKASNQYGRARPDPHRFPKGREVLLGPVLQQYLRRRGVHLCGHVRRDGRGNGDFQATPGERGSG